MLYLHLISHIDFSQVLSELLADLDACDSQKDAKSVANGELPTGQCNSLLRTSEKLLVWFLLKNESNRVNRLEDFLNNYLLPFRQEDPHQEQDQTNDGCFPGKLHIHIATSMANINILPRSETPGFHWTQ